jgi:hypothetical protein
MFNFWMKTLPWKIFLYPEDRSSRFLLNFATYLPNYTALQPFKTVILTA